MACQRPEHVVPEDPDDSPEVWLCSPFIVPSLIAQKILMMSFHDIMIVCSDLPAGKPLHMCIRIATVCASAGIHARTPNTMNASEPHCLFLNPIFTPVTLSPGILVHPHTGVLIY